jgi:hypothetical protein
MMFIRDAPDLRPDNPAFFDIRNPAGCKIALPDIRLRPDTGYQAKTVSGASLMLIHLLGYPVLVVLADSLRDQIQTSAARVMQCTREMLASRDFCWTDISKCNQSMCILNDKRAWD